VFVAGSAIFTGGDPARAYRALADALAGAEGDAMAGSSGGLPPAEG
jgi:hypothetical protein